MNAIIETANEMSKRDIIDFYKDNYSLSFEEYEEMEEMTVTELRALFVEGESC